MKVLQLSKNNKPFKIPKIFTTGVDFDIRPLFEVDGHCEFDVIIYIDDGIEYQYLFIFHPTQKTFGLLSSHEPDTSNFTPIHWKLYKDYGKPSKTPGSIFTKENQEKYPKLLKKALGLIN